MTNAEIRRPLMPEERAADRFLASRRKRYAGEDKTVYVNQVPLKDCPADAAELIIRDLLERLDDNLGMDVATWPGPSTPSWAIRAAVAEEREACAKEAELWKRTTGSEFDPDDDIDRTCLNIAAAIRVRV